MGECRRAPLGASGGGGRTEVLKCSKLPPSSAGEISVRHGARSSEYSIAGKRTGTAVSRHRGQRKLDWRLSCDCRQQAAFIDAPRRWYYASMRFLKFRVTTGDGLATIVCASARSVTPHGGLTTLRHNSVTFCCAPWRCSAIIDAQSRSTELSGGFHVQLMKFDTFIKGFKQIMYISGSLVDFQR